MGKQWAAQWKVNSLSDPTKVYTVSVAKTGRWACDCPAHRFAKNGPDGQKKSCKHILKTQGVEQVRVMSTDADRVSALQAASKKVRATVVVNTQQCLIIQTRREICLEED